MKVLALALFLVVPTPSAFARQDTRQETSGNGADHWGADYFPNIELTTHEGKRVHFFDDLVKDKVVLINFIYTSCPDSCPLETARLAEVQDILGERVGRDVFMYSISIDPAHDTPEVLARYAERFQVKPGWLFLTGKETDVALLRQKLGLLGSDEAELKNHSLSLVIGNQSTGRWMRRSPFENAFVLANQLGDWLHDWKAPRPAGQDYANAPELRTISRGESLFRTRCSACHVVGTGDGLARLGPNLVGVLQRRERAWVERWIAAPDEMLASGDPVANDLFAAYNRVSMPNMRLNELEISALLEYIDGESQRALATEANSAASAPVAARACCLKRDNLVLGADSVLPAVETTDEAALADDSAAASPKTAESKSNASLELLGVGLALVVSLFAIGRRLRV